MLLSTIMYILAKLVLQKHTINQLETSYVYHNILVCYYETSC